MVALFFHIQLVISIKWHIQCVYAFRMVMRKLMALSTQYHTKRATNCASLSPLICVNCIGKRLKRHNNNNNLFSSCILIFARVDSLKQFYRFSAYRVPDIVVSFFFFSSVTSIHMRSDEHQCLNVCMNKRTNSIWWWNPHTILQQVEIGNIQNNILRAIFFNKFDMCKWLLWNLPINMDGLTQINHRAICLHLKRVFEGIWH